ncbi:ectopic P granules protein 5 homolog [Rhincodon typus]|uniref:ectopic P granules protein 5 homolog n=1 Tax=Rhincodon typus TaxID=259920 RepID=UPI00202E3B38|nr:ectopic P granules protein 5 homolog [Rhincodon typus]
MTEHDGTSIIILLVLSIKHMALVADLMDLERAQRRARVFVKLEAAAAGRDGGWAQCEPGRQQQGEMAAGPNHSSNTAGSLQVSYLANVVRLSQSPEALFNHWAWELVVRLKLCSNHPCNTQDQSPFNSSFAAPELNESANLHPLSKAVKAGIPIGCYLALSMTSIGHSIDKFCSEGIPLLGVLIQSKHLKAVVHVLDKILPLFYPCQYYLLKNEQFLMYMQLFLQTDSGVLQGMTQQVTQKVAQHLTGISYGENIKLLNSMIQV